MRLHVPIALRWSDMDAYNHVNNARIFTLLEEARVRAFWAGEDSAATPLSSADDHTLTLIARQEIEYVRPIEYRVKPIYVQLWCTHLGTASCDVAYEIFDEAGEELYVRALTTVVFVDAETQRPRRLRDDERDAWQNYLGDAPEFRRRPRS